MGDAPFVVSACAPREVSSGRRTGRRGADSRARRRTAEDLPSLLEGVIAFKHGAITGRLDPVVAAAAVAFGFVYIHPFEDGNGRLHRWLIHHVLARAGFNPPGLVFPVSAAILRQVAEYRRVLGCYSRPLLNLIEWRPTPLGMWKL